MWCELISYKSSSIRINFIWINVFIFFCKMTKYINFNCVIVTCNINDIFFLWCFYKLFTKKNVFVKNHCLLYVSGTDMVSYSINQPLRLCWIQMQMGGAYDMIQHAGLIVIPHQMSIVSFLLQNMSYSWTYLNKLIFWNSLFK